MSILRFISGSGWKDLVLTFLDKHLISISFFSIDPLVFTDYPLRLKFCVSGQIGQTLPSMV
jgi:hypothetical protein